MHVNSSKRHHKRKEGNKTLEIDKIVFIKVYKNTPLRI